MNFVLNGIYVHIPFCSRFCTYCNFYSVKGAGKKNAFIEALLNEIVHEKNFFASTNKPYTLYIGGGTPSLFAPDTIALIADKIIAEFNISNLKEFTVEVNPDDITSDYAFALYKAGVNRISMGIQSFNDRHLKWMNRRHSAREAERAYYLLRESGFKNISLDLIFGYGLLSKSEWEIDLDKIISLKPEHISSYQMSVEHGTPLWKMYESGAPAVETEEESAEQYEMLQNKLNDAGYEQYEISNFALPRKQSFQIENNIYSDTYASVHNSSYWNGTPYIGLGPSAHSFSGYSEAYCGDIPMRRWNKNNVTKYIDVFCGGKTLADEIRGYEKLSNKEIFNEKIMLGLRKVSGLVWPKEETFNPFFQNFPGSISQLDSFKQTVKNLKSSYDLVELKGHLFIPRNKLFLSDMIIRDLLL